MRIRLLSIIPAALAALASPAVAQTRDQTRSAAPASTASQSQSQEQKVTQNSYAGMWVTEDGYIRHELLSNGRYVEARGARERAYEGRYEVTGSHIEYWDDTGFTADGDFADKNTLHHGGMVLRRK
ncbi:Atu4866 domain-containing protein [Sinorhizobium sp. 7-81]|uniref:Atu4866 domain-containing protein n=1 Tax=Sinorhizobium sp. 8-89 TaxID=3049089 RepID=UPI0024C3C075|nr:Atu4866 domain-containing protein [Sinorhizobium sp. 8-89]MDK1492654.1 Atu4866 domain-containing protein [Sinorhizobium sp. 8-89]